MTREEYRAILSRLPIKSPTPQDMALLCPHLTEKEAVKAFMIGSGYVACPPLRVKHGFEIVSYHKEYVEEIKVWGVVDGKKTQVVTGTKNHPTRLDYSFAGRTFKSYADGQKHDDLFNRYTAMDKAMKFAEDNWGNELILDDWVDVMSIYIQDPTDLVNDKYHKNQPRTKAVLYVAYNRDWNELINDHSKPESELMDDAISQMTLDFVVYHELKGGRVGFTEFNCAHCGHGLSLTKCGGCGYRFDDNHCRRGWNTPLSHKMVAFLRANGHEFKVDLEIAWENERKRREKTVKEYEEMLRRREQKK